MFQSIFSTYSQSTPYADSFNANFTSPDENYDDMIDSTQQFYGSGGTPINPSAYADSCVPSVSPEEVVDGDRITMIVPFGDSPAQPATLQPPISTSNSIHYSYTVPTVEDPESDTDDFSTSVSPSSNSYNHNYEYTTNVNVNLGVNEATINTVANIVNHDVQVEEHVIDSTAHVVHHSVDVDELVQNSIATVENHYIDIHTNDSNSIANVDNHHVDIQTNDLRSVANVDNHSVDVHTSNTCSTASVENHFINVKKKNLKSTANVDNHFIDVEKNNFRSIANVDNHFIDVEKNNFRSIANVDNHHVDIQTNDLRSVANVDNHFVDVHTSNTCSTASVENHFINVIEKTLESTISVPKFVVNIQEKEVPINISMENLSLQLLSNILQLANANSRANNRIDSNCRSSISTQTNSLDVFHKELVTVKPSLIDSQTPMLTSPIPKSYSARCSILEDEAYDNQCSYPPQSITESDDFNNRHTPPAISPYHNFFIAHSFNFLSISTPIFYSSGDCNHNIALKNMHNDNCLALSNSLSESSAVELHTDSTSSDRSLTHNSSHGISSAIQTHDSESDNSPSGNDGDPPSHASPTFNNGVELFDPETLRRDLMSVRDKNDLRRVRQKWNRKEVNDSLFGIDAPVEENPLMWNVVISREWPEIGLFVCPDCLTFADDVNINFRNHASRVHNFYPIDASHNAVIAKIIGRSHIWRLQKEGNEDVIIESVYTCPIVGCKYFTNDRGNFHSLCVLISN